MPTGFLLLLREELFCGVQHLLSEQTFIRHLLHQWPTGKLGGKVRQFSNELCNFAFMTRAVPPRVITAGRPPLSIASSPIRST